MTPLATAITLMRMALALLDREGRPDAAARLQHAIDTATGEPPMQAGDEVAVATVDRYVARPE